MVRRPAAVLGPGLGLRSDLALAAGVPLIALVYFLAAPALPALSAGDEELLVAGGAGLLMIAATALALVPAYETFYGPLLIVVGAGLLMAALNAAGVGAGANVAEAMVAGAFGLLFARALAEPQIAVAVPLFVAAIDVVSAVGGSGDSVLGTGDRSDALSFDIPAWGDLGSAGTLAVTDAVFVAMFASWAWRFGFRRAPTLVGLALGLVGSLVASVALGETIPALPLIAAGYLLPNVDRVRDLFTEQPQGRS